MIQLRTDCLVFRTADGEIPCSAEQVAIELVGDGAGLIDPDLLKNAAAGVLHYFREELGRQSISLGEFSVTLVRVLQSFGVHAETVEPASPPAPRVVEADLRRLACESGKAFELAFFPRLRRELQSQLERSPRVLRFTGLRSCVKQLVGARRWCERCQRLSDQIVEYLRQCLRETPAPDPCALVVL